MSRPLRIYLAGPWTHKAEIGVLAAQLEGVGHTLTCRWWEHAEVPGYKSPDITPAAYQELVEQADADLAGVKNADVFLLYNPTVSEGKAVETGYALAERVPVLVVGERSNLFHYLPQVTVVPSVEQAITALRMQRAVGV